MINQIELQKQTSPVENENENENKKVIGETKQEVSNLKENLPYVITESYGDKFKNKKEKPFENGYGIILKDQNTNENFKFDRNGQGMGEGKHCYIKESGSNNYQEIKFPEHGIHVNGFRYPPEREAGDLQTMIGASYGVAEANINGKKVRVGKYIVDDSEIKTYRSCTFAYKILNDNENIDNNTGKLINIDTQNKKNADTLKKFKESNKENKETMEFFEKEGYDIKVEGDKITVKKGPVTIEFDKDSELTLIDGNTVLIIFPADDKKNSYIEIDLTTGKGAIKLFDEGKTRSDVKKEREREREKENEEILDINRNPLVEGQLSITGDTKLEKIQEQIKNDLEGFEQDIGKGHIMSEDGKTSLKSDIINYLNVLKVGNIENYKELENVKEFKRNSFKLGLERQIGELNLILRASARILKDYKITDIFDKKVVEYTNLIRQYSNQENTKEKSRSDKRAERKERRKQK